MKNLWKEAREDPELSLYFPDDPRDKRHPPREFFFNIVHTVQPEFLKTIISHSQSLREERKGEEQKTEVIEVSQQWKERLLAHPYFSSKLEPQ